MSELIETVTRLIMGSTLFGAVLGAFLGMVFGFLFAIVAVFTGYRVE